MVLVHKQIETMILDEVKGLCTNCANAPSCAYFQSTEKAVIQCELFELDIDRLENSVSGLCRTCDNSRTCKLPGRYVGVWHCDEFI